MQVASASPSSAATSGRAGGSVTPVPGVGSGVSCGVASRTLTTAVHRSGSCAEFRPELPPTTIPPEHPRRGRPDPTSRPTRTPRGVRRLRRLGARRGRGQAHLLRPLRPAAPRPGGGGHRRRRRLRRSVFKDLGLVSQVFDEQTLRRWRATSPSGTAATPPPAPRRGRTRSRCSATPPRAPVSRSGHNGNLVNTTELRDEVAAARRRPAPRRGADRRHHRLRHPRRAAGRHAPPTSALEQAALRAAAAPCAARSA